MEMMDT